MAKIVPITPQTHGQRSWRRPPHFGFSAREAFIFLSIGELPQAALRYPICFVRYGESLRVVALVGLEPGSNLCLTPEGGWLESYLPILMRTYPFALMPTESGERVLCVDDDCGLVQPGMGAQPFYNSEGGLDTPVAELMRLLVRFEQEKVVGEQITSLLDKLGLVVPWDLSIPAPGGGIRKVEGLFTIDEEKMNALSDEDFISLRRAGGLSLAYCQMLSTQNIVTLVQRAQARRAAAAAAPAPVVAPPMELDFSSFGR